LTTAAEGVYLTALFTSRLDLARVTSMMLELREPAAAESYPTFWDAPPRTSASRVEPPDDAYGTFVNLTEEDLPADFLTDVE
jgi:hypothetical protein